jgi:lysophospholipase L1-like esterase
MSLTAKLMLSPLLVAQARAREQRLPRLPEPDGDRHGTVGEGPSLRLLIMGDSSAAGVGVHDQRHALAGYLSQALARRGGVRVQWRLLAQSGLTSAQCLALLREHEPLQADVAVVAAREAIANHLRNACGVAHVVFAPLPPVHHFPGLPQPLRWVAGQDARRHDRAVAAWARTRRDVSHVPIDLPLNAGVMAMDGFHPGETVYRICGTALAEHIAERVWPALVAA